MAGRLSTDLVGDLGDVSPPLGDVSVRLYGQPYAYPYGIRLPLCLSTFVYGGRQGLSFLIILMYS